MYLYVYVPLHVFFFYFFFAVTYIGMQTPMEIECKQFRSVVAVPPANSLRRGVAFYCRKGFLLHTYPHSIMNVFYIFRRVHFIWNLNCINTTQHMKILQKKFFLVSFFFATCRLVCAHKAMLLIILFNIF